MKRTTLMTTALLLLPLAAEAQQGSDRSRVEARESRTAEGRIDTALLAAFAAGIPPRLLERKVDEGRAKGVAAERIATAVETRLAALVRARQWMEGRAQEEGTARTDASVGARGRAGAAPAAVELSLLVATADAMEAGVDGDALTRVWTASTGESRTLATATTAQLVRLGHPPAEAAARVTAALGQGGDALEDLSERATAALGGSGTPPSEAAAALRGGPLLWSR